MHQGGDEWRESCVRRAKAMRILLGPILFILDVSPVNQMQGYRFTVLLISCMAVLPLRPRWWSLVLAILAAMAWLFLGVVGDGIDC